MAHSGQLDTHHSVSKTWIINPLINPNERIQIENKVCMWMHLYLHPLYDLSNMEFPKVCHWTITLFDLYQWPPSIHQNNNNNNNNSNNKSKQTLKCPLILIGTTQTVNEDDNHNVVGVTIDCNLSWSSHVTTLCKVFPRKCTSYIKINTFWSFMHANYFFMPIFSPSSTTDRRCGLSKSKYS